MKRLCSECVDCTIKDCKTCSIGQQKIEEFEIRRILSKFKKDAFDFVNSNTSEKSGQSVRCDYVFTGGYS